MLRRFKKTLSRAICGHSTADNASERASGDGRRINEKPLEVFAEHPAVRPLTAGRIPHSSRQANILQPLTPPTTAPPHVRDAPGHTHAAQDETSGSSRPEMHQGMRRQTFRRWDSQSSNERETSAPLQIDQSERATTDRTERGMLSAASSTPRLPVPEFSDLNVNLDVGRSQPDVSVDTVTHSRPAVTHEEIKPHVHTVYHPVRTRSIHIHEHRFLIQPIVVPASPAEIEHSQQTNSSIPARTNI